jgi:hypothetical protein
MSAVLALPIKRKRGAKVRTGPCAQVIPMPGLYLGEDLDERYEWIKYHHDNWATTKTEGRKSVDNEMRLILEGARIALGKSPLTDHVKRAEIERGRARIETRNRIKTYLERRGVDIAELRNAEDALFALFGFMETSP